MKKILAGFALFLLLVSCQNKRMKIDPFAALTKEVDSLIQDRSDTLKEDKQEAPKPTEEDESFDDFIYSFASNKQLQQQRVIFPLPYYNGDVPSKVDKRNWKHDPLFTNQQFYTLIFDLEKDMDVVGDTSLTTVKVEWIYIKTRMMKRYYFEKIKGVWMLEALNLHPIEKSEEEDFIAFYGRFAADSLFQQQRIKQPLVFVTTDPDDDFSILETTLDLNQWFAFRPILPVDKLSNINYGQQVNMNFPQKILALKGVGNGFSSLLYFQRKEGLWELYRFEDTSI